MGIGKPLCVCAVSDIPTPDKMPSGEISTSSHGIGYFKEWAWLLLSA